MLAIAYLVYDVALSRGADLPGGDLRLLAVALYVVLVLVIGSVVTYLVVPAADRLGDGRASERLERGARVLRRRPDRLPRHGRRRPGRSGRCSADGAELAVPRRTVSVMPLHGRLAHPYRSAVLSTATSSGGATHVSGRIAIIEVRACPSTSSTSRCRSSTVPRPTPGRRARRRRRRARSTRTSCRSRPTRPTRSASSPRRSRQLRLTTPGGVRIGRDGKPTTDEGQARPRTLRPARHRRPLPQRRLTGPADAHPGVASPDGGVAQSVRAAGLYPAGSRFESWLPYQPRRASSARGRPDDRDQAAPATLGQAPLAGQRRDPGRELVAR